MYNLNLYTIWIEEEERYLWHSISNTVAAPL